MQRPRTRRKTELRKQPRQARSRVTVDAILIAAEQVIEAHGLRGLTTVAVAERAGVSVGTLYQYFASKEAIAAVLIERNTRMVSELFRWLLDSTRAAPLADSIPQAIRALIDYFHSGRGSLQGPLVELRSSAGRTTQFHAYLGLLVDVLADYLAERKSELRITDPAGAAYVLVHASNGVAHALAHAMPDREAAERVIANASEVVMRYLVREPRVPLARPRPRPRPALQA